MDRNVERIEREKELHEIGEELKEKFLGNDSQIDQLIAMTKVWYCYPEFLQKPTIINLWGITGVGKTALVREFVKKCNLHRTYIELRSNEAKENLQYSRPMDTISKLIRYYDMSPKDFGVILMDEFQLNRTKGAKDGLRNNLYKDYWTLISDGTFIDQVGNYSMLYEIHSSVEKAWNKYQNRLRENKFLKKRYETEVQPVLYEIARKKYGNMKLPTDGSIVDGSAELEAIIQKYAERKIFDQDIEAAIPTDLKHIPDTIGPFELPRWLDDDGDWLARRCSLTLHDVLNVAPMKMRKYSKSSVLQGIQRLKDGEIRIGRYVETLAGDEILAMLEKKLDNIDKIGESALINEDNSYVFKNLLIFNCGNLDGLFDKDSITISPEGKCEIEKFYKLTSSVTHDDIMKSLYDLFLPEHVSRLGINHIYFPSLNTESYTGIIKNELSIIENKIWDKYQYYISLQDEKHIQFILDKFVKPTQGTRGLFTGMNSYIGELIPYLMIILNKKFIKKSTNEKGKIKMVNTYDGRLMKFDPDLHKEFLDKF